MLLLSIPKQIVSLSKKMVPVEVFDLVNHLINLDCIHQISNPTSASHCTAKHNLTVWYELHQFLFCSKKTYDGCYLSQEELFDDLDNLENLNSKLQYISSLPLLSQGNVPVNDNTL